MNVGEITWGEMIWGEMNVGCNDTKHIDFGYCCRGMLHSHHRPDDGERGRGQLPGGEGTRSSGQGQRRPQLLRSHRGHQALLAGRILCSWKWLDLHGRHACQRVSFQHLHSNGPLRVEGL